MKSSTVFKFIFSFVLVLLAVAFVFFGLRIMNEKTEEVKLQFVENSKVENFDFGNQLRENIQKLTKQEARIKSSFISSTKVLEFIQSIETLAGLKNLTISIDKVERGADKRLNKAGASVSDVTFTLQTRGTYEQTLSFVEDLLGYDEHLLVSQFNLYRVNTDGYIEYTSRIILTGKILSYE